MGVLEELPFGRLVGVGALLLLAALAITASVLIGEGALPAYFQSGRAWFTILLVLLIGGVMWFVLTREDEQLGVGAAAVIITLIVVAMVINADQVVDAITGGEIDQATGEPTRDPLKAAGSLAIAGGVAGGVACLFLPVATLGCAAVGAVAGGLVGLGTAL